MLSSLFLCIALYFTYIYRFPVEICRKPGYYIKETKLAKGRITSISAFRSNA